MLVLAVCSSSNVFAQGLAKDILTASELTDAHKAAIRQFVDQNKDGLSESPEAVARSRKALIANLQKEPKISVAFRLEYARLLGPVLRPLAASDRDVNAINALTLAGELATTSGIDILGDRLADKRAAVRFAAVDGFTATFSAIETTSPAIAPAQQAIRAISTLKSAMEKETDANVLEAYCLALRAATKVPSAKLEGVRPAAVKALSEAISARARATDDATYDSAFRRSVNTAREALTVQAINEPQLPGDVVDAAAGMAGDVLACVLRRLTKGELDVTSEDPKATEAALKVRADFVLIVADAESSIQWANTAKGGNNFPPLKLAELIQQKKDSEFQTVVLRLIGPQGYLTNKPFPFKDDHFVK